MNHVLELFIKLKIKGMRNVWSLNLMCEEVATSKLIPYCSFSIFILNTILAKKCGHQISH